MAQTVVVTGTTSYTDTYVYSQHALPLELLRTANGVLNRYWSERDGLGNVVALTDVNGTVVDQYAYDLWGKPTIVYESVPQQLRYQGYWYDNELGWYWLTTRAYDPTLERFLQPDPSEQDGLYSYAYVNDDPVDMNDPSGFAASPIYCDSRCQGLIVLFNVWPVGMSVDQFVATGGSLDAPIQGGYDAGSHQWTGDSPHPSAAANGGSQGNAAADASVAESTDPCAQVSAWQEHTIAGTKATYIQPLEGVPYYAGIYSIAITYYTVPGLICHIDAPSTSASGNSWDDWGTPHDDGCVGGTGSTSYYQDFHCQADFSQGLGLQTPWGSIGVVVNGFSIGFNVGIWATRRPQVQPFGPKFVHT